jgi:hypothetical protein
MARHTRSRVEGDAIAAVGRSTWRAEIRRDTDPGAGEQWIAVYLSQTAANNGEAGQAAVTNAILALVGLHDDSFWLIRKTATGTQVQIATATTLPAITNGVSSTLELSWEGANVRATCDGVTLEGPHGTTGWTSAFFHYQWQNNRTTALVASTAEVSFIPPAGPIDPGVFAGERYPTQSFTFAPTFSGEKTATQSFVFATVFAGERHPAASFTLDLPDPELFRGERSVRSSFTYEEPPPEVAPALRITRNADGTYTFGIDIPAEFATFQVRRIEPDLDFTEPTDGYVVITTRASPVGGGTVSIDVGGIPDGLWKFAAMEGVS